MMAAPRSAFEVRRSVRGVDPCGYREVQVELYIREEVAAHGISPSYAMIRDALRFCDEAGVLRVVERLERKGRLIREGRGRARRIRLVINNK